MSVYHVLKKRDKISGWLIAAFAAAELILGILIQIDSLSQTNEISYASVILALVFSVILADLSLDSITVIAALFFTCLADYCLLILPSEPRLPAMIFFITVQLIYFARLCIAEKDRRVNLANLLARFFSMTLAVICSFIILGDMTDIISILSMIYFSNLIVNIVFSLIKRNISILFSIGLILFALCDIFVGFRALADNYFAAEYGTFLYRLSNPNLNVIWLFYVPSQTLIAISSCKAIRKK